MAKVTVTYDLPEDTYEFELAMHAGNYNSAICEYLNWLRDKYKYKGVETISTFDARQKLIEILEEQGVDTNEF